MKVYLFRHGETDWNKAERLQCSIDIELNETGIQQAHKTADILKDKKIKHIYSSKQKRAYKTGKILADKINVAIEIVDGLHEMMGGDFEGKIKSEIYSIAGKEQYDLFSKTRNEAMDWGYPNGETKRDVRNRITNTVLNICKNSQYDIIGIASHGFVLREFLRGFNFEDDSAIKNCEVIEADYDNGNLKVLTRITNKQ